MFGKRSEELRIRKGQITMKYLINRRSWLSSATNMIIISACVLALGNAPLQAKPGKKVTDLSINPVIQSVAVVNGQLIASGTATAIVKGTTVTSPFTAPVTLRLAPDQSTATDCPILDLTLGPINLDLLGLVVETSPICLQITAHSGDGLLGNLLCNIGGLLNGTSLADILAGLTATDLNSLLTGLTDLLNGALGNFADSLQNLLDSVLTAINPPQTAGSCAILHLELGPVDLTLLGLQVVLDNCAGGPVTVDITAEQGRGNLLGNLLCDLLGGNLLNLGSTLQDILNQILALLG
jgi:hypothetical protein